jgi:hypothetical protein
VSQQHGLHIRERERTLEQRIIEEINLADREVIRRAPIGIHFLEQIWRECFRFHGKNLLGSDI